MVKIFKLQVMDLSRKAHALKELPGRKIAFLESFRGKDLKAVIAVLKQGSHMNIINEISNNQNGISEITQLMPNGQLTTWRRNDYPNEDVEQGIIF